MIPLKTTMATQKIIIFGNGIQVEIPKIKTKDIHIIKSSQMSFRIKKRINEDPSMERSPSVLLGYSGGKIFRDLCF